MMKKRRNWLRLTIIIIFVLLALGVDWPNGVKISVPKPKVTFSKKSPFVHVSKNGNLISIDKNYKIKEGLDLQGGSSIVYSADLSGIAENKKTDAMDSLKKVIENRVNAFGVAEPLVQTTKSGSENRITVELAGVSDTEQAMNLIGKTAQLDFRELDVSGQSFKKTLEDLTGKDFTSASVGFDPNTNEPVINIEFNSAGAKKFEDITGRNVGKPLAIYLDDQLISYPTVNQQITGGKGVIQGKFDVKTAKDLAIQLNAGALPVPIKMVEQRTVGATLGQDSVKKSMVAGVIGIFIVSVFMILYYRLLGVFSTVGLVLYLIFMFALFKVFPTGAGAMGITLTMGGVAGLILSVGMSMETDVLVFERIREEMRNGRNFAIGSALGFQKAWPSIRDSNVVSLIIVAILYTAGGMVRGFAVTLGLGIIVGLLTTFYGTRTLIDIVAKYKFSHNNWLYRVEPEGDQS